MLWSIDRKENRSQYFYHNNKNYQILEIEGKDSFRSLTVTKWDEKSWVPISWKVAIAYEQYMYFYTKKQHLSWKKIYTFLRKGTKKVFQDISIHESDENGKPTKWKYWIKGKRKSI